MQMLGRAAKSSCGGHAELICIFDRDNDTGFGAPARAAELAHAVGPGMERLFGMLSGRGSGRPRPESSHRAAVAHGLLAPRLPVEVVGECDRSDGDGDDAAMDILSGGLPRGGHGEGACREVAGPGHGRGRGGGAVGARGDRKELWHWFSRIRIGCRRRSVGAPIATGIMTRGSAAPSCKKQLVYGAINPLTEEQCKLQLKRWRVADSNLAGPQQRKDHVCLNARRECAVGLSEAECDEAVMSHLRHVRPQPRPPALA